MQSCAQGTFFFDALYTLAVASLGLESRSSELRNFKLLFESQRGSWDVPALWFSFGLFVQHLVQAVAFRQMYSRLGLSPVGGGAGGHLDGHGGRGRRGAQVFLEINEG